MYTYKFMYIYTCIYMYINIYICSHIYVHTDRTYFNSAHMQSIPRQFLVMKTILPP